MSRPKLLYLSVNDGTDTRIAKEIATLVRKFEVTFVGVRQEDNGPNRLPGDVRQVIVSGPRRSPGTLARLAATILRLNPARFDSVHVVNENLLLVLCPLLLGARNVVLDVFDSIFLRQGVAAGILRLPLQWLAHVVADAVLVTDDDRRRLVPSLLRGNVRVLPNYPRRIPQVRPPRKGSPGDPLRIFFSGSLSAKRGTRLLTQLMDSGRAVEVTAAGWIYDDAARRLCAHPSVRYLGVLDAEGAALAAMECDYILCVYSPDVPNNVHASPNKIYDGAMLGVPVIINAEVIASSIVAQNDLGVVLPSYDIDDPVGWADELVRRREHFRLRARAESPFLWDACEPVLLDAHLD